MSKICVNEKLFFLGIVICFSIFYLLLNYILNSRNTVQGSHCGAMANGHPSNMNIYRGGMSVLHGASQHGSRDIPLGGMSVPLGLDTRRMPIETIKYPRELNNPYHPPVKPNIYPQIQDGHNGYQYKQYGFIFDETNGSERLPLFGRIKYGTTDKYEYFTKDSSVHENKVFIDNKNNKELYSDDEVTVKGLPSTYKVHMYDTEQIYR